MLDSFIIIHIIDIMKLTSLSTCKKYKLTLDFVCRKSGIKNESQLKNALLSAIAQKNESEKQALTGQYNNNEILRLCNYFGIVKSCKVESYEAV